jgi:sugar phosphate isomerase/epimerase
MELGLFTPVFNNLSFDAMLAELKRYPQIQALEIGTGCWPGSAHIEVDKLLSDNEARKTYLARLADSHLYISALSCHGNPVHPQSTIARNDSSVLRKSIDLALKLGVKTVVCFSGCPGGSEKDESPNWITAAWPPEFSEALQWQWAERLIPYWKEIAKVASDAGVRIALEAHPGYAVYNPETLLKLRAATGESIGINLDPSHLWWQGMDIPATIRELGQAIHHFHAKDVAIDKANRARNGVLDTKSYAQVNERSWLFRSVGCGHSELEWKQIIAALRLARYDGVISIEHEDALASQHEGLSSAIAMLDRVILREPPVAAWWM